jgi:3-hydroxy-3-methylglutaryl CoA synthase/uncharacterized OB-fold protein
MTRGITAYAAYLPHYKLSRQAIADGLGEPHGGPGSRSVASFDEDAITMGVAAARRLRLPGTAVSRIYLATSSPPYLDKSNAVVVNAALGGTDWVLCIDLAGLRSGLTALYCASETGGLAVLSDMRTGLPGSPEERDGGDGAAAFLFGEGDEVIAEILGTSSISLEIMDGWRAPGREPAFVWEERFAAHVYGSAVRDVIAQVGKETGRTEPATHTIVSAAIRRFAASAAAGAGSEGGTGPQDAHREDVGYCGAAESGILLARALDAAKRDDTILVVQVASGVDAMLLRVLRDGPGARDLVAGRAHVSYNSYLTWRGFLPREPARRPDRPSPAAPPAFRNRRWKYALEGSICLECRKVYLPPQRVCGGCGAVDSMGSYSVADRAGTVVSTSTDSVTDSPNPPALVAIVDFDGGGRITCDLTDCRAADATVGSKVRMTFRSTYAVNGTPNYFWKAEPIREGDASS